MIPCLPTARPRSPESEAGSHSFYSTAGLCGAKAWFDREGDEDKLDGLDPERRKPIYKLVGTIVHSLLEHYHGKGFGDVALETDNIVNLERDEAIRLFDAYRKKVPAWAWGTPLGSEILLPRTDEEKSAITELLGVSPWKGIIDLVTELDQRCLDFWYDAFQLELPGPGVYVVDHKSMKQRHSDMLFEYTHGHQLPTYALVWKTLHKQHNVRGAIANCLIGNKEPAFEQYFGPFPLPTQHMMIKQSLAQARRNADTREKNSWACKSAYGFCGHYKSGKCDRVNNG